DRSHCNSGIRGGAHLNAIQSRSTSLSGTAGPATHRTNQADRRSMELVEPPAEQRHPCTARARRSGFDGESPDVRNIVYQAATTQGGGDGRGGAKRATSFACRRSFARPPLAGRE